MKMADHDSLKSGSRTNSKSKNWKWIQWWKCL